MHPDDHVAWRACWKWGNGPTWKSAIANGAASPLASARLHVEMLIFCMPCSWFILLRHDENALSIELSRWD